MSYFVIDKRLTILVLSYLGLLGKDFILMVLSIPLVIPRLLINEY